MIYMLVEMYWTNLKPPNHQKEAVSVTQKVILRFWAFAFLDCWIHSNLAMASVVSSAMLKFIPISIFFISLLRYICCWRSAFEFDVRTRWTKRIQFNFDLTVALAVQIKFCIPDMYVSNYKASWMNLCKLFMWMIGHVLLNETQIYCFSFRLSSIVNHLIDIKAYRG